MNKASFLSRFWALLVDWITIWIVGSAIGAAVTFFLNASAGSSSDFMGFLTVWVAVFLVILVILLQFLYFGLLWSGSGQSLGMKIFKMKVVRRDDGPVSFLRAAFRGTVGYWISSLFFFLGYLWAAFDSDKEAWHDKIFDTWVVDS